MPSRLLFCLATLVVVTSLAVLSLARYAWLKANYTPPTTAPPRSDLVICIDPGHPTLYSSGKRLLNGVTELDINWAIANQLSVLLQKEYHLKTVITRRYKNELMSNRQRAIISNQANAALFIRLHCDSGPNNGFTIYFPDRQSEDSDLGITGPSPAVISASRDAAFVLHDGMKEVLKDDLKDRGIRGESRTKVGRKYGALTASILSASPTLTVEMVFLNNKSDATFIKSSKGKDVMTRALAEGINDYISP